jgi:hypothetical protein
MNEPARPPGTPQRATNMTDMLVGGIVFVLTLGFIIHCPILKPWFGFRKPPGHQGRWFE